MKRRIVCLLLLVVSICSIFTVALASEYPIAPCYNHTASTSTSFSISSSGKASIAAAYNAYPSTFEKAIITTYIEKRTLGLFWTKVDIDQTNNEWVDSSTDYAEAFGHTFQLENTGTYRATVVYEISGTGGATDVIEYEQERTYS